MNMNVDDGKQGATMNCGPGVAERELLHDRLRSLPETMPPRAVWQRIEAQARAEGLLRAPGIPARLHLLAGAGLAAAVVLTVLAPRDRSGNPPETFPTEPAYVEQNQPLRLRTLNALMVESRQLEDDLRSLPDQPQLVRAGTAATIAQVEDQIAAIDYRLNEMPVGMTHEQLELYWRERVRLMNLLVQLRAAQSQRGAF